MVTVRHPAAQARCTRSVARRARAAGAAARAATAVGRAAARALAPPPRAGAAPGGGGAAPRGAGAARPRAVVGGRAPAGALHGAGAGAATIAVLTPVVVPARGKRTRGGGSAWRGSRQAGRQAEQRRAEANRPPCLIEVEHAGQQAARASRYKAKTRPAPRTAAQGRRVGMQAAEVGAQQRTGHHRRNRRRHSRHHHRRSRRHHRRSHRHRHRHPSPHTPLQGEGQRQQWSQYKELPKLFMGRCAPHRAQGARNGRGGGGHVLCRVCSVYAPKTLPPLSVQRNLHHAAV